MTFRAYIWGTRFLVLVSAIALIFILSYLEPQEGKIVTLILFYLSFLLFLSGLCVLLLLSLRRQKLKNKDGYVIGLSFRQGTLLAVLGTAILALQGFGMLIWWDALLVVAGVFLIELYFLSKE